MRKQRPMTDMTKASMRKKITAGPSSSSIRLTSGGAGCGSRGHVGLFVFQSRRTDFTCLFDGLSVGRSVGFAFGPARSDGVVYSALFVPGLCTECLHHHRHSFAIPDPTTNFIESIYLTTFRICSKITTINAWNESSPKFSK